MQRARRDFRPERFSTLLRTRRVEGPVRLMSVFGPAESAGKDRLFECRPNVGEIHPPQHRLEARLGTQNAADPGNMLMRLSSHEAVAKGIKSSTRVGNLLYCPAGENVAH